MIGSSAQADERSRRDVALRRAAGRRLHTIRAEIDDVTRRRVAAWGHLAQRPSQATAAQIETLSARLTTLWSEARAMRACVRYGARAVILERARSEPRGIR